MFSGVAGGLGMGLTGLGVASAQAVLGNGRVQEFVSPMLYPLGFVSIIIGRQQLFTENTLDPVALILSERKHAWRDASVVDRGLLQQHRWRSDIRSSGGKDRRPKT